MIPSQFEEVVIRVFTRNPQKTPAIQKAFRKLLKQIVPPDALPEPSAALTLPNDYADIMRVKRARSSSFSRSDNNGPNKRSSHA